MRSNVTLLIYLLVRRCCPLISALIMRVYKCTIKKSIEGLGNQYGEDKVLRAIVSPIHQPLDFI